MCFFTTVEDGCCSCRAHSKFACERHLPRGPRVRLQTGNHKNSSYILSSILHSSKQPSISKAGKHAILTCKSLLMHDSEHQSRILICCFPKKYSISRTGCVSKTLRTYARNIWFTWMCKIYQNVPVGQCYVISYRVHRFSMVFLCSG